MAKRLRVSEPLEGIKNLDTSQPALGIVVGSDAFRQMFRGDGSLAKNNAQCIDLGILGDLHD